MLGHLETQPRCLIKSIPNESISPVLSSSSLSIDLSRAIARQMIWPWKVSNLLPPATCNRPPLDEMTLRERHNPACRKGSDIFHFHYVGAALKAGWLDSLRSRQRPTGKAWAWDTSSLEGHLCRERQNLASWSSARTQCRPRLLHSWRHCHLLQLPL